MGVFSYVVFATPGEAQALLDAPAPLERFEGYGEKACDPGRWAALASVLGFGPDAVARIRDAAPVAAGDPSDGPWVFELPSDLLEHVSTLHGARLTEAAQAWLRTDPVMGIGGDELAHQALGRLVSAAQRAVTAKEHVLVLAAL